MNQNIRTNYDGIVKSERYSYNKKPKILKAYGEEYEIPVKTKEFTEKLVAVIKAIGNTSTISDTVREIKNGITLFIGEDEAERIFPDENFDQIDIDEILDFWAALNHELAVSQQKMLDEYTVSEGDKLMENNLLFGTLPSAYEYNGRIYEMQTDFRDWIKFDMLFTDEDIPMKDKFSRLIEIIFPIVPDDITLWDFIMWFYHCGKKRPTAFAGNGAGKGTDGKKRSAVYSFRYDDEYIYSAFLEVYGVNLASIPYLHWWEFKAMFNSLHDCKFTDIMGYRAETITSKTPAYMKDFLTKMKKIYALPRSLSEQQKIDELKRMKEKMGY